MTVELKPEIEAFIQKRLQSGAFETPEQVIERALEFLAVEEDWLSENRDEIAEKIQNGWNAAKTGELIDDCQLAENMKQRKQAWLARQIRS